MSPSTTRIKIERADLVAGGILVVFAVVLAWFYVNRENAFYFHDFIFYQLASLSIKQKFFENPLQALFLIVGSTYQTYNYVYTLPLIPFQAIFGESRVSFIEGVVVLYLIPYILSFGAIFSIIRTSTNARFLKFWLCVFVATTIPAVWASVLRGYPDVGAAFVLNAAALLYLRDMKLSSKKQIFLIGLLLGLAPLIRRHFVYTDAAFMFALVAHQLLIAVKSKESSSVRAFIRGPLRRIAGIGLSAALFLFTVGFLFVFDVLTHNYPKIYQSFHVPLSQGIEYFTHSYGIVPWVMALAGFALLVRADKDESKPSAFILVWTVADIVIWLTLASQLGIHYTLHFNAFLIVGIAGLLIQATELPRAWSAICTAACSVFLIFNLAVGLSILEVGWLRLSSPGWLNLFEQKAGFPGILFSANYHPLFRTDKEEVFRLVKTLRNMTPDQAPVMVAAGSDLLNRDTLRTAEKELFGMDDQKLKILKAPYTDSEECYPLERLIHAQIVVIATPIQLMIEAEHEHVLTAVLDCFEKKWPLAGDFEKVNESFKLQNGAQVTVFRRVRPTSLPTAIDALERIKAIVGQRPAGQPDWIGCGTTKPSDTASEAKKNAFIFACQKATPDQSRFLLSTESLPRGKSASGRVKSSCGGGSVVLSLMIVNKDGSIAEQKKITIDPEKEAFDLLNDSDKECYFVIEPGESAQTEVTTPPPAPIADTNKGSRELILKDLTLH